MRHAQYRQELADTIEFAAGVSVAQERRDPARTPPTLTVQWTGSTRSRTAGWAHSYDVEIAELETGPILDRLVAEVAAAVDTWKPNTSAASASSPTVRPVTVIDGDVQYPAILVSTVVTEPAQ